MCCIQVQTNSLEKLFINRSRNVLILCFFWRKKIRKWTQNRIDCKMLFFFIHDKLKIYSVFCPLIERPIQIIKISIFAFYCQHQKSCMVYFNSRCVKSSCKLQRPQHMTCSSVLYIFTLMCICTHTCIHSFVHSVLRVYVWEVMMIWKNRTNGNRAKNQYGRHT